MKTGLFSKLRRTVSRGGALLQDEDRLGRWFLAYCVAVILSFCWTLTQIDAGLFPGDFISFYGAGHIIGEVDPTRVLDLDLQYAVQERLLAATGRKMNGAIIKFLYPPAFAWVFLPLTWLPLIPAYVAWSGLNLLMLLAGIRLLLRQSGKADLGLSLRWGLSAVCFLPVLLNFLQGQTGVLLFFLLTVGFVLIRSQRPLPGGLVLGLGLIKPQLILLPITLLLFQRRWRAILGICVAALALVGASAMTVGGWGVLDYPRQVSELLSDEGINPRVMPSLRGTIFRLDHWLGWELDRQAKNGIALVAGAAGLFWAGGCLHRRRKFRCSEDFPVVFSLSILVGLLLSPHLFAYDLSVLILPGLAVTLEASGRPSRPASVVPQSVQKSTPGSKEFSRVAGWLGVLMGVFHLGQFVLFLLVPEPAVQQLVFLGMLGFVLILLRVKMS